MPAQHLMREGRDRTSPSGQECCAIKNLILMLPVVDQNAWVQLPEIHKVRRTQAPAAKAPLHLKLVCLGILTQGLGQSFICKSTTWIFLKMQHAACCQC